MFNDTITVFNRYHSKTGDVFYPHVIRGCQLLQDKASIIKNYGSDSADNAKVFINCDDVNGVKYIDGIEYLTPKAWANQTNDKLADTITFNDDKTYFDFFVVGEYTTQSPILDDSYTKGFYNELNSKLDGCYAITSVAMYSLIPHFELMAK